MMRSVYLWKILMAGAVVLWLFALLAGLVFYSEHGPAAWALFFVLIVIHILEIPLCIRLGRKHGVPAGAAVIRAMVFGFTWWVPLKRGILNT